MRKRSLFQKCEVDLTLGEKKNQCNSTHINREKQEEKKHTIISTDREKEFDKIKHPLRI